MDPEELERLAQEELLQEAKRAKARAEDMGPIGWQRCPLPTTNKRFLHNVVVSTLEPKMKRLKQRGTDAVHRKTSETVELKEKRDGQVNSRSKHSEGKSKHKCKEKYGDKGSSKDKSSHKSKHRKLNKVIHY